MRLADVKETSLLLQECTSAVSIDAEEQLYKAAVEQNITTITISQRNTLPVRACMHTRIRDCTSLHVYTTFCAGVPHTAPNTWREQQEWLVITRG